MSSGPIQQWRDQVSTPDKGRVCFAAKGRGYCGRTGARTRVAEWSEVTCFDCIAAARADGVEVPA